MTKLPPTMTKIRRAWLMSLKDGQPHEVAQHNGVHPQLATLMMARWDKHEGYFRVYSSRIVGPQPRVLFSPTGIQSDSDWPDFLMPATNEWHARGKGRRF